MKSLSQTRRLEILAEKRQTDLKYKRHNIKISPSRTRAPTKQLMISPSYSAKQKQSPVSTRIHQARPSPQKPQNPLLNLTLTKMTESPSKHRSLQLHTTRARKVEVPDFDSTIPSANVSGILNISNIIPNTIKNVYNKAASQRLESADKYISTTKLLENKLSPQKSVDLSKSFGNTINIPQVSTIEKEVIEKSELPMNPAKALKVYEKSELPMNAAKALKVYKDSLNMYEQGEVLDYQSVYFIGDISCKIKPSASSRHNYGFDDENGDYKLIVGDHIAYRYEIMQPLGKGSFGQVIKAMDHREKRTVALKIIRNKSRFHHQAGVEVKILKFLKKRDSSDDFNVVHILDYLVFRKHICISFELLSINLYEFIKNNNYSGISTNLIRRFAIQILRCLKVLREYKIIHCDLKPENILLRTANRSGIKIIDFGSSCFEEEKVYTYIQSRFYRAPEIMFGIPYTTGIDMWSFGCILAELYTGYPLFPGESEAEQMCCIMEVKGLPPPDMIETSSRSKLFFESKTAPKIVTNSRGKKRFPGNRPLQDVLRGADERFIHLIDSKIHLGCLNWDPTQRITPEEALNHDWIAIHIPQPSSVLSKQKKSMSRGGSAQPHQGSNKKVQEVMHTTKVLSNGSVFQIRAAPLSAKYAAKKSFVF